MVQTPAHLPLTLLFARCRQETRRFWQGRPFDPAYCHALFGRALAQPLAEESKQAWQYLHQTYHRQVTLWVKGHPHFPATGQEPEMLADLALEKMWLAFARSPEKYGRFPQNDSDQGLRALLRYLQSCVHSVVINAISRPSPPLPENIPAPHSEPRPLAPEQFWDCIEQRLQDEKERLLLDATFVYGLKPRQILTLYASQFADINEIYRLKENLLARFRRDASLRHCLEMALGGEEGRSEK
ncbi:MAG: hypothetical protein R6X32_06275 [Chloroflexota bacterium]